MHMGPKQWFVAEILGKNVVPLSVLFDDIELAHKFFNDCASAGKSLVICETVYG